MVLAQNGVWWSVNVRDIVLGHVRTPMSERDLNVWLIFVDVANAVFGQLMFIKLPLRN